MTPEQLSKLEQGATKGPWEVWPASKRWAKDSVGHVSGSSSERTMHIVAKTYSHDSLLITAMRNILPTLIELWKAALSDSDFTFKDCACPACRRLTAVLRELEEL